jgi:hypothetical protein
MDELAKGLISQQDIKAPPPVYSIVVKCPVNVIVTNQEGKQIGVTADGTPVNQVSGAGFLRHPESDGTFLSYFVLPIQDIYKTELTGTGEGTFRLITGAGKEPIQDYGEQPISKGQRANITLDSNNLTAPLSLPDGRKVMPREFADGQPGQQPGADLPHEPVKFTIDLFTLIIGLAVAAVIIILVRRRITRARLAPANTTASHRVQQAEIPGAPTKKALTPSASPSQIPSGIPLVKSGYDNTSLAKPSLHSEGSPCSKCGSMHPRWAKFCNKCGNKFEALAESKPEGNKCSKCGNINRAEAKFCNKCGIEIKAKQTARVCPVCNDPVVEGEAFCNQCGAKIEAEAKAEYCPSCGDPVAEKEKFCNNCGRKLT